VLFPVSSVGECTVADEVQVREEANGMATILIRPTAFPRSWRSAHGFDRLVREEHT
jgi:hypothetical protein